MTETNKTIIFCAVAAVVATLAIIMQPSALQPDFKNETGTKFFPDFDDPLRSTQLEILEYDETLGEVRTFRVAKADEIWSIPSHENYPADAEKQLAEAAAAVIDLKKVGIANENTDQALKEEYGVVDPEDSSGSTEGIGKRIKMMDSGGDSLAELIVGNEVEGQNGLRYVRQPAQDFVFTAQVDTVKLSTKFEDWIEDDLLKLDSFDIRNVILNNYSIDEVQGRLIQGDNLTLTYNDTDAKWSMEGLTEEEEIDSTKVNDLKYALDDLKIVDVRRKPTGFSRELRLQEGAALGQGVRLELQSRGFFLTEQGLFSNEGEVVCTLKDGVQYVLRFGEIATGTGGGSSAEETTGDENDDADTPDPTPTGSNRYIFVTAQLDESMIAKPELETLPETAPETSSEPETSDPNAANESSDAEDTPAEDTPTEDTPAEATPECGGFIQEEKPTPSQEGDSPDQDSSSQNDAPSAPQPEKATPAEESANTSEPSADSPAAAKEDATPDPLENASTETGDSETPAAAAAPSPEEEKERIEKANAQKLEAYNTQIQQAKDRVKELNDRFADWYYVISDEVYRKIHLSRVDLVKAKGEEENAESPTLPNSPLLPGSPALPGTP